MISLVLLFILMLLIVGSALWASGGIVLLDFALTPYQGARWWDPIVLQILDGASYIFGYAIISKIFFIGVLCAAAYLGVLLARWLARQYHLQYLSILEFFGGAFFLINPFAYERMMVQPLVYAGVIALGYGLYFLLNNKYIVSGLLFALALAFFPHASYMILLIVGLYCIFFVRSWWSLGSMMAILVIVIFINLNWIFAPYLGIQNGTTSIGGFDMANLRAFQTQALAPMGVWLTNIFLYGFWGERYGNHYANVGFLSTLWYLAGSLLLLVLAVGKWRLWRFKKGLGMMAYGGNKLIWFLGIIAVLSLIFAIGIASPMTVGLTEWMIGHLPMWQGYREPQKWIGLLMIVEGILFIVGIGVLLMRYGKDIVIRWSIIVSTVLLLLVWSPGPLMSYHGQLRTTVYPVEFSDLRKQLLAEGNTGTILALPWHSYIGCLWMGRPTVTNPIQGLLAPFSVVSSDNIEVSGILYSNSRDPRSTSIEQFFQDHDYQRIYPYGITNIVMMKGCVTPHNYGWLDHISACKKTISNNRLDFYECAP